MLHAKLQILGWCALCAFAIVAYGSLRCKMTSFTDPLTFALAPPPFDKVSDGWAISHFAFYAALAYFYPRESPFIFTLGVTWELIEFSVRDKPFYLSRCNYKIDTDGGGGWWYGRWEDLVVNAAGIATGLWLARR